MRLRDKTLPPPRVGDRVTTDFERGCESVVRTVTAVVTGEKCESGVRISMDAGAPCAHCRRAFATHILGIDSRWAIPADEDKR